MTKLLLVEDNQLNREMFSRRLERKGFEIITAGDGKEALMMAENHLPALVLMDLSLPIMDGWTATRHLKSNPSTKHIPVIALTAHAMVGDREKALSVGCDDYDTKPVDLPGLLAKINSLLHSRGEPAAQPSIPTPSDGKSTDHGFTHNNVYQGGSSHGSAHGSAHRPGSSVGSGHGVVPTASGHSTDHGDESWLLVVDDNPMNREMLLRRLQRENYRVTVAGSGSEAIEFLEERPYDLILLDMMMPEMDGLEMLSIIRSRYAMLELPIIVVTAKDESEDMVTALKLGANDYVTKPFNFPVLMARVQTQLNLKQNQAKSVSSQSASPGTFPNTGKRVFAPSKRDSNGSGSHPGFPSSVPAAQERPVYTGTGVATPPPSSHDSAHDYRPGDTIRLKELASTETDTVSQEGSPDAPDGAAFADYEVIEEIGRGGMGVVFKARHKRMNRLVALKVINKEHLARSSAIKRFYREIQAAAHLSHRNIVLAYDAGQVEDTHFFAMEYVEGIDLQQMVQERGPLPIDEATGYILQAARGLQHVFERGMVHRDIKPSNLLVTWDTPANIPPTERILRPSFNPGRTTLKILDLGLALLYDPADDAEKSTGLTRDGRVVGTADYMAPEQWMNAHKVDIRADLYSLGVAYYFLISGKVPFPGDEPMEKMLKHHLDEPIPITDLVSNVPPVVTQAIDKLLQKKPENRFQTPATLAEALV